MQLVQYPSCRTESGECKMSYKNRLFEQRPRRSNYGLALGRDPSNHRYYRSSDPWKAYGLDHLSIVRHNRRDLAGT